MLLQKKEFGIYRKMYKGLKQLGVSGKMAVAGLNPHSGEHGLFGDEEVKEITPAIEEAQKIRL